jgi:dolichol-phosphate mannosyltransferase
MLNGSSNISARVNSQVSIVLPAFNEEEVLPLTFARLQAIGPHLAGLGLDYEFIFVNDGSIDRTTELLNKYATESEHVRAVHLTRNFGHQAAVSAGLALARGDAVVLMDCDLQDPPEVLPQLIEKWREGFSVVYAVRRKRKEWFGKRLAYWSFYRLLSAISELDIPLDSGDFCLMDRRAVDLLCSMPESQRFVRGLRTWVGLRQTGVPYERDERQAGEPSYDFRALRKLAMDGLIGFSNVPLKMVTRLGALAGLIAVALGIFVVTARLVFASDRFPWGWSSMACLILLASSVQLLSLGVIGEYMSRIFIEVKRRPTYLIAEVVEKQSDRPAPTLELTVEPIVKNDRRRPVEPV